MVELVNVGMGDEKEEAGSYIILACNRKQLVEHLQLLLPEFSAIPVDKIERQPKAVLWNKAVKTIIYGLIVVALGAACSYLIDQAETWMIITGCSVIIGFGILISIMHYVTAGTYFDEHRILVANGSLQRTITVMPLEVIQYFDLKTSPVLRHWGLVKGNAHILASAAKKNQEIPACEISKLDPYIQQNYL